MAVVKNVAAETHCRDAFQNNRTVGFSCKQGQLKIFCDQLAGLRSGWLAGWIASRLARWLAYCLAGLLAGGRVARWLGMNIRWNTTLDVNLR